MSFDINKYPNGGPCSAAEIEQASQMLGHSLPGELTVIYSLANGLRGPTNTAFLYPLVAPNHLNQTTAVSFTEYLRSDPIQPSFWKSAIAFGDYGVGATWGIRVEDGQIFEWWPEDGEEVTIVGSSILQVWAEKEKWYEELA